jgi:CHAT domain-containing protein
MSMPSITSQVPQTGSLISVAENLDLVIFHSAPLIKVERNTSTPLHDSTLDFEVERRLILETFKRNEIGLDIRFDAATTEKLIEILDSRPKLIHISCHGYYSEGRTNEFFLAFEHHT